MTIEEANKKINEMIENRQQTIRDLETVSAILETLGDLIAKPTVSPLFEFDYSGDEFVPRIINPRANDIVIECIDILARHFGIITTNKIYLTNKEG